jgi:hypothetical protein
MPREMKKQGGNEKLHLNINVNLLVAAIYAPARHQGKNTKTCTFVQYKS